MDLKKIIKSIVKEYFIELPPPKLEMYVHIKTKDIEVVIKSENDNLDNIIKKANFLREKAMEKLPKKTEINYN